MCHFSNLFVQRYQASLYSWNRQFISFPCFAPLYLGIKRKVEETVEDMGIWDGCTIEDADNQARGLRLLSTFRLPKVSAQLVGFSWGETVPFLWLGLDPLL